MLEQTPTTSTRTRTRWGLPAPTETSAYWGARAIDERGGFDILHDRQSYAGDDANVDALIYILNDLGALRKARERWTLLKSIGEVSSGESQRVILYEDALILIEANTNASHGYVYLVAFFKPLKRKEDTVWSCDDLPKVGDTISSKQSGWASTTKKMRVLGYMVEHNHLYIVGELDSPTESWVKQSERQAEQRADVYAPSHSYWNAMGREWEKTC